jgi:hypothetical protein
VATWAAPMAGVAVRARTGVGDHLGVVRGAVRALRLPWRGGGGALSSVDWLC